MERKLILASHHRLADGLKDTLEFISGISSEGEIIAFSAYLDNEPVEKTIKNMMAQFPVETEVVILTDMTAGSVNQKFFNYRMRPHTQIISGMNLPLALALFLEPKQEYLTTEHVEKLIEQAKNEIVYINELQVDDDDDDE